MIFLQNVAMENTQTILQGHTDEAKTAYLIAIASIATADRQASEDEMQSLVTLCESADLPEQNTQQVISSASDVNGDALAPSLTVLKDSELKYSLITDLIAFAKTDSDYSDTERQSVEKIATYLGVNQGQFSLLNQVADKTTQTQNLTDNPQGGGFLSSLGIEEKLKSAGINGGSLLKGLIAFAAPILISKMMSRRSNSTSNNNSQGGMFGGANNGGGGLGGLLGGGGLGSLIGMLNGGRGFGNAGGLLGKIFGN
jgi:uncharacterized tellurite resistance protein B-like protein